MNKTTQIVISAIIAAVGAAMIMIMINPFDGASVHANQGGRSDAQRWEYCAITNVSTSGDSFGERGVATVRYFYAGGGKEEKVEFVPEIGHKVGRYFVENEALSKVIARLGDEGWEMILKEPITETTTRHIFYFKRPKQ